MFYEYSGNVFTKVFLEKAVVYINDLFISCFRGFMGKNKKNDELSVPDTLPDDGLLLGWSLEHEHRKPPIGFAYSKHAKDKPPAYLEPILYKGNGHLMTIASTGSGKGISCIIPTLLRYQGPIIVIDPKGENVAVTSRRRKEMGHKVIVLDPFEISDYSGDRLNPLDLVDKNSPYCVEDAATLAELSMAQRPHVPDPFWEERARQLITCLILHVALARPPVLRTLSEVRYLLNQSSEDMAFTVKEMRKVGHPELSQMASVFQAEPKVLSSIIATAQSHFECFRGQATETTISGSTFSLDDITTGESISIYIVIPPDKLETHAQLLRLWIGVLMTALMRRTAAPDRNTLFVLDEAAQLGPLRQLRQAITLLRGYGLLTWSFWQDMSQLTSIYPNDWETMYNNCKAVQYFGMNNLHVARSIKNITGFSNEYDLLGLDADELLLSLAGDEPVIAQRPNYLTNLPFSGMFDGNPYHSRIDIDEVTPRYPQRIFKRKQHHNTKIKKNDNSETDIPSAILDFDIPGID